MSATFRVLGPLEVGHGKHSSSIPGARPRALLAALLIWPNEFVSSYALARAVWGDPPPDSYRSTLHTYIMRLRRFLAKHVTGPDPILSRPGGYLLETTSDSLDLLSFRQRQERAKAAEVRNDPGEEMRHLASALSLWRGPPLADVDSDYLHTAHTPRLTEQRLALVERRVDLALGFGEHAALVCELRSLTANYPHREQFWRQLMQALYCSSRRADALTAYHQLKDYLAEWFGLDPADELQQLQLQILRGESVSDSGTG